MTSKNEVNRNKEEFRFLPTGLSPSMVLLSRELRLTKIFIQLPFTEITNSENKMLVICANISTFLPQEIKIPWFGLLPFRSPLLREYCLVSFSPGTEMFHFPGSASLATYVPG